MRLQFAIFLLAVTGSVYSAKKRNEPHSCSGIMKDRNHAVCSLFPESTEGPYYVPDQAIRQDITEGKPGVPLELSFTVVNFTNCLPIANVAIDLWHCDAGGLYSSFINASLPPPPTRGPNDVHLYHDHDHDIFDDDTFLRGVQYTNQNGEATFKTIFPGWYRGRTVHMHVTTWLNGQKHTGQLYFVESLTAYIASQEPYSTSTTPRLTNALDGIFQGSDGKATTLILGTLEGGYQTHILMGFDK